MSSSLENPNMISIICLKNYNYHHHQMPHDTWPYVGLYVGGTNCGICINRFWINCFVIMIGMVDMILFDYRKWHCYNKLIFQRKLLFDRSLSSETQHWIKKMSLFCKSWHLQHNTQHCLLLMLYNDLLCLKYSSIFTLVPGKKMFNFILLVKVIPSSLKSSRVCKLAVVDFLRLRGHVTTLFVPQNI